MIVGTGVDLCEVARIRHAIEAAHGKRFLDRVFTPAETAYADRHANRMERFAARFAAKEAAMKALGTGWSGGISWQDLEVARMPSGRPTMVFHGKAAELAAQMNVVNISLSMTHTAHQAMAMVILEDAR